VLQHHPRPPHQRADAPSDDTSRSGAEPGPATGPRHPSATSPGDSRQSRLNLRRSNSSKLAVRQADRSQQEVSNPSLRDATRASGAVIHEHVTILVDTDRHALRAFGTKRPWVQIPPPRQQNTWSESVCDQVAMALGDELRDYRILFTWVQPCRWGLLCGSRWWSSTGCGVGNRDQANDRDAKLTTLVHPARPETRRAAALKVMRAGVRRRRFRRGSLDGTRQYSCDHCGDRLRQCRPLSALFEHVEAAGGHAYRPQDRRTAALRR